MFMDPQFYRDNPKIIEQGIETWYHFVPSNRDFNYEGIIIDDNQKINSLVKLLERKGKKLKVSLHLNDMKESDIKEFSEKKMQPLFIAESYRHPESFEEHSYTMRQYFVSHIDEKGYTAKLIVTINPKIYCTISKKKSLVNCWNTFVKIVSEVSILKPPLSMSSWNNLSSFVYNKPEFLLIIHI